MANKLTKTLLPPDSFDVDAANQDFCNIIRKPGKKTIPCSHRNNYILCWDAECESLHTIFPQSPCHCPISADAIASQIVRNGRYKVVDCKSSQFVSQEVSDLWRITTPNPVNISEKFLQRKVTAAQVKLQVLTPSA